MNVSAESITVGPRWLNFGAWGAQLLVALVFGMAGFMKATSPIPELAGMIPWAGQLPLPVVRGLGVIDLAGAIGMVVPPLLRWPRLSVAAAAGCVILQLCAIVFHLSRGEASVTPLNLVLLAASGFVLWVRLKKVPIVSR